MAFRIGSVVEANQVRSAAYSRNDVIYLLQMS
jgi:hypothetical protein